MRIFCILGKSASGKDTLYNKLLAFFPILSPLIPYTTRKMRIGEKEGREYWFISNSQMNRMEENGELIEKRSYNTVNGTVSYATADVNLEETKDYLLITTLEGFEKIEKKYGKNAIPLYIDTSDDVRLIRSILRERNNPNPNYREIFRRYESDGEEFREEKLEKMIHFNNDIDCFFEVVKYLENNYGLS